MAGHKFRIFDQILTTKGIEQITEPNDVEVVHRIRLYGPDPQQWVFGDTVECGFAVLYDGSSKNRWIGETRPVPEHLLAAFAELQKTVIPVRWWFFPDRVALRALRDAVLELKGHPDMVALKAKLLFEVRMQCRAAWHVRLFWHKQDNGVTAATLRRLLKRAA